MKTRHFIGLLFLAWISTGIIHAQKHHKRGGTVDDKVNRRIDRIDSLVTLTTQQKTDLKVLFTSMHKKRKDAICTYEEGSDDLKNAMKSIRKETKDGMAKILTPDQIKTLKAYRKEHKKNGKGRHGKTVPNDNVK